MKLVKVDSLSECNENLFKSKYIQENQPVLLKGLAKTWPAFRKWSLDFFYEEFGEAQLPISSYAKNPDQKYKDKPRISMAKYIEYVKSLREKKPAEDSVAYAAGWHFDRSCPELLEDIQIPKLFANNLIDEIQHIMRYEWISLFIGHPYCESPLHTDSFFVSTWLTCIRGSKLVRLIPGQYKNIKNGLNVFDDQVLEELRQQNIPVYEAQIAEGDTLFMPSGWWHHVINLDESIAL